MNYHIHNFKLKTILLLILIFCKSSVLFASDKKLPIPRFVTIKSSEANIRTGPNLRYPIKWIFKKKNEPVEVTAEFEHWRKIRDITGEDGWIHESMLKGKRAAIIIGNDIQNAYNKTDPSSKINIKIEPEVRVFLSACKIEWCQIKIDNYKGWIEKKYLWGTYPNEVFDK
ncbi:MAG: SH3 domain-containing protein [Alphaproteobacteria bacterium]